MLPTRRLRIVIVPSRNGTERGCEQLEQKHVQVQSSAGSKPPAIWSYGLAVLSVGAALIISRSPAIHLQNAPVSLFLSAVIFSAWCRWSRARTARNGPLHPLFRLLLRASTILCS